MSTGGSTGTPVPIQILPAFSPLLALLALAACQGRPAPSPNAVTVLVAREPDTLDPRMCVDPTCVKVTRLLYRSLVTIDPETLELVPDLARSITEVDPLRYDVVLRPGVTFHSGRALTAEDAAATLRTAADPALGSPYQRSYARFTRVEVTGPLSLTLRLSAPHATVLGDLELPVLPRHLATTKAIEGETCDGTGPFRLTRRAAGALDLAPFARVEGRPPPAAAVRFRLLADDNTRALRLLGGGGDFAVNAIPSQLVPVFARAPAFRVLSAPSTSYTYLGLNVEDPVLSDVRVRQAIAYALDRRTLVAGKFSGRAVLATAMIAPGSWAYEPDVPRYGHDPARARALLAEAGHPRLSLTLLTSTDRFRVGLSRAIAWMLGRAGMDVTVRPMEMGSLKSELAGGRFQAFTMQIPEVLEPNVYDRFFHSAAIPTARAPDRGANRFRYRSAEADRLIEAGRSTTDRAVRKAAYAALQRRLAEDLPCVPLWHEDNVAIVSTRVRGAFASRTGRFEALASVRLGTQNARR